MRPAELHSRSAEENCPTEHVSSLRSVQGATPPCAAKAAIPVDLPSANSMKCCSPPASLISTNRNLKGDIQHEESLLSGFASFNNSVRIITLWEQFVFLQHLQQKESKETFSYFSLTPFGYANFAPLITATLTVAIFLLSLFSLKKKGVLKALFVLSIITVVISLLPLMYGLNYYTLVGAFITVTLVIESILAKIQQKVKR